jgi:hypothetical protein
MMMVLGMLFGDVEGVWVGLIEMLEVFVNIVRLFVGVEVYVVSSSFGTHDVVMSALWVKSPSESLPTFSEDLPQAPSWALMPD